MGHPQMFGRMRECPMWKTPSTSQRPARRHRPPPFPFRFVPDKEFSGTERGGGGGGASSSRAGPVQFEKEEDPFGLDQFLDTAKRASGKRSKDDDERRKDSKKKRRDY